MTTRRLLTLAAAICIVLAPGVARALNEECTGCHAERVSDVAASSHGALICETCHEGAAGHAGDISIAATVPLYGAIISSANRACGNKPGSST